jgi:hypothetical protein
MRKYIRYTVKGYNFEYHLNDIRTYESVTVLEVYDGPEQAQDSQRDRVRSSR